MTRGVLPMSSAIACRRSQAPVASDPMLLVVAHRLRLLAAISTSPAATLTLQAGLCLWLRPTVSTLWSARADHSTAAVFADQRSSETVEEFTELFAHFATVFITVFDKRLGA